MGMTNDINFEEMATKELNVHRADGKTEIVKAQKKPVVIEAIQWTGDNGDAIREFMKDNKPDIVADVDVKVLIHTMEGTMEASSGDWIIRGVKGEYYPCKPDIFEETYEIVGEAE